MTYRDITFCASWEKCEDGKDCFRALTPEVIKKANEWIMNAPISVCKQLDCFKPIRKEKS